MPLPRRFRFAIRWRVLLAMAITVFAGFNLLGSSTLSASDLKWLELDTVSHTWDWDFAGWELDNIGAKLETQMAQPAAHLDTAAGAALVRSYMDRAQEVGAAEYHLDQLYAQPAAGEANAPSMQDLTARRQLETSLTVLNEQQALVRPAVEQVIQNQVSSVIAQQQLGAGFKAFPPVWFT
ncbi:MAG: hypothetical protein U0X20_25445, partial [Caldilineaceae bacterium]